MILTYLIPVLLEEKNKRKFLHTNLVSTAIVNSFTNSVNYPHHNYNHSWVYHCNQNHMCAFFTLWNLAVLYIMEPNALPYIDIGASCYIIDDIMPDIIGTK